MKNPVAISMRTVLWELIFLSCLGCYAGADERIPNEMIDEKGFRSHVNKALDRREPRRVTEATFINLAKEPDTVILDARSASYFGMMHIAGAKNLPFTEFTEQTLAAVIPTKTNRILIYCNNNITGEPIAFASKAFTAALNLSTYTSLYSYGYENVFELGPVVDPRKSKIQFEGTLLAGNPAPSAR